MGKKKETIDVIEIAETECKKMTNGLFYNLDDRLAIIIRDLLIEFAEKHATGKYPGLYECDPRLSGWIYDEKVDENDRPEWLWKHDILGVAQSFDEYISNGEKMEFSDIKKMFAKLAFIFPMLWT